MTKVFSNKLSFSSPGRSATIAETPLLVWEFCFTISQFMLLPPCGYTLSECSFCVFYRAQNVLKLATEILPAISKLKFLKANNNNVSVAFYCHIN